MRIALLSLLIAGASLALAGTTHAAGQVPQSEQDIRRIFAQVDTNGDGEIDLAEFHARLVEVFYQADTNKDGFLSPEEYNRLPFSGDFKAADTNGDGRISLHEFVAIRFRQFEQADTNHDGALSFEEVLAAYQGRTNK
jgi:Ca2+-binding EF-hand superfamily protein